MENLFLRFVNASKMQNLNLQKKNEIHEYPSTITVKLQKFNPQIKLFYKDLQNYSRQNFHAIQYEAVKYSCTCNVLQVTVTRWLLLLVVSVFFCR